MVNTTAKICLVIFSALLLAAAACGTGPRNAERMVGVQYPEPRYPSYLKPPSTIDEVLPHVRPLARNTIGFQGNGLGIAQSGETVAFILAPTAEDMIVQAVKKAMEERGVKVSLVPEYEVAGVSKEDAAAFEKARRTFTSQQGYMEATWWVESNFHDHGFHTHTYFSDYQVHLRNADRWVKLIEKGRLTSLDNPEVRALASRYGNPDQLLTEDWRPEMPGINAPGDYLEDYAPDPWRTVKDVIDRVLAGTYEHFFPTTEH